MSVLVRIKWGWVDVLGTRLDTHVVVVAVVAVVVVVAVAVVAVAVVAVKFVAEINGQSF